MGLFRKFWNLEEIPHGIRVLTFATAIRWIGWGFGEPLIPVFLYSFGSTFAEAGLLKAVYDIAFILALPLIGMAADRMFATTLIAIGLVIYLFIGASYFLAGVTGLVIFAAMARFLNGISFAMDAVGRETYFRRHTPREKLATVFGYFDSVANFWWIMAAIAGIFLIQYIPLHTLLFLITPTSLITLFIVWRFRKREENKDPISLSVHAKGRYLDLLKEIGMWNWKLRSVAAFNFFIAFCGSVVGFFLPIEAYTAGAGLGKTIIIAVVFTIPSLFGWVAGKWFDRKGASVFFYSLAAFAGFLGLLTFQSAYLWRLVASFAIGVILEVLSVGNNELVTVYSNPEHFGRVGGIVKSVADVGSMMGPLFVGILIDAGGSGVGFGSLAILMCLLAMAFYVLKNLGFLTPAASTTGNDY
jgi:DHA1 family multidrug resistance protein-like MFS transporter